MTTHALRSLRRTLALVAMPVLAASLVIAAPVAARTPVDPNTLNPSPPDFFNAECWDGAAGTVCTLHFSDDPIFDEASGMFCGSTELLFSQTRSVVGKRFYDADGNILQRHFREELDGLFTNPLTGQSASWHQHDTVLHNVAVAGDLDTGTIRFTGLYTRIYLPGGGTIQSDTGTFSQDPVTGEIYKEAGKHPFNDYFVDGDADAFAPLCEALGLG